MAVRVLEPEIYLDDYQLVQLKADVLMLVVGCYAWQDDLQTGM